MSESEVDRVMNCKKTKYQTKESAEFQAKLIVNSGMARSIRVYGCREHGPRVWHLTSKRPQDSSKGARRTHNAKRRTAWELPTKAWENEGGALHPRDLED